MSQDKSQVIPTGGAVGPAAVQPPATNYLPPQSQQKMSGPRKRALIRKYGRRRLEDAGVI